MSIPVVLTDREEALAYSRTLRLPVIVKVIGMPVGRGTTICSTDDEVQAAIDDCMTRKCFGKAGEKILILEYKEQ